MQAAFAVSPPKDRQWKTLLFTLLVLAAVVSQAQTYAGNVAVQLSQGG